MSHSSRIKRIKKDAITQTSDIDTISEIVRLQELVKHLTIENERLKKYAFNSMMLTENQTNVQNPSTSAQNVQRKSNKHVFCGCKSKKSCSTKACGCIKKGVPCGELCKCNSVSCKNLRNADQNKENVEHSDTTTFHEDISGSKNIFHNSTSTEYLTVPTYFNSSEQVTSVSNDEEKEKEDKDSRDIQINDKICQSGISLRKNRSKRNNSKRGKQKQSDTDIKEETLNMCSPNEIPVCMDEELKQVELKIEERTNENFENIGQGMTTPKYNRSKAAVSSVNEMRRKNNTNTNLKEENDFNPMKPTYELPRTPPNTNSDVSSRNISEVSLPTSFIIMETEEELPLPEEFNLPHVNWEEYHSQLVECNKCSRKFHPFRIKKHQACCKKV
ncbi:uncharacterized protein LOC122395971 [Colletes gigas]|uniref:uncharacterized protein LOC122395971 n=1 Tax=Colletes gigas TaxID=935657 RepID=UPI001C9AB689|nr:uncharacterized protein LOC122395971 [Colletes gigas]XP_043249925.1 uncharacterized protein LOC122395971 [Colletes gigas]XP_043249926.1 uncharacterized protein LOC122395971 [Colletes gigas]